MEAQPKDMPIVMYLGSHVKEYGEISERIIEGAISRGKLRCELCLKPMRRHSTYTRGIKETGEKIAITMVWCSKCKKWHALLPDFLLPNKHYSGNEVEAVIIESAAEPVSWIDTPASETTVRRWVRQISGRVRRGVGILKVLFGRAGRWISEVAIDAGQCYGELEQVLEMAPDALKCSGNKLGLANMWLWTTGAAAYI